MSSLSLSSICKQTPVPVAVQSKARMVLDHSKTGIVGSNPAQHKDVCPCLSLICCPLQIEAFWWGKLILYSNSLGGLIRGICNTYTSVYLPSDLSPRPLPMNINCWLCNQVPSMIIARSEVFTTLKFQVEFWWLARPRSVVVGYQRFGGPFCVHLQGEDRCCKVLRNVGILPHTIRRHNLKMEVARCLEAFVSWVTTQNTLTWDAMMIIVSSR